MCHSIACEQGGEEFSWSLPNSLRDLEHVPTNEAVKKHVRKHNSGSDVEGGTHLLAGVREMVADVTSNDDAVVSVKGVVDSVLRFQGIILTHRDDLKACTDRLAAKVSSILDPSEGVNERGDSPGALESPTRQQQVGAALTQHANPLHVDQPVESKGPVKKKTSSLLADTSRQDSIDLQ